MYLKQVKHSNIILFLVMFTSFFSIAKIGFNPTYLIGFSLIFIYSLNVLFQKSIQKNVIPFLLFFLVLLVFQSISFIYNPTPESKTFLSSALFLYSILLTPVFMWGVKKTKERKKMYKCIFTVLLIFLLIELIVRVYMGGGVSSDFYMYKKGFFYYDSNFTGLVILNFLFLFLYLSKRNIYKASNIKFILLWLFLFLTISRASILTAIIVAILFNNLNHIKFKSTLLLGIGFTLVFMLYGLSVAGVSFVEYDGSFNSKFSIIIKALVAYEDYFSQINKLFGIGLGNTKYILEVFAHNIAVTFVLEFGILGSAVIIYFMYYISKKTNGMALIIIIPNLIEGFSLFSAYSPFVFISLGVIYHEETNTSVKGKNT